MVVRMWSYSFHTVCMCYRCILKIHNAGICSVPGGARVGINYCCDIQPLLHWLCTSSSHQPFPRYHFAVHAKYQVRTQQLLCCLIKRFFLALYRSQLAIVHTLQPGEMMYYTWDDPSAKKGIRWKLQGVGKVSNCKPIDINKVLNFWIHFVINLNFLRAYYLL